MSDLPEASPTLVLTLAQVLDTRRSAPAKAKRRALLASIAALGGSVYVVRNAAIVLYVGVTRYNAPHRLRWHVNSDSPLGKFIKAHRPRSSDWMVEVYVVGDFPQARTLQQTLCETLHPVLKERGRVARYAEEET